jgi:hypothetical protein
LPEGKVFFRPRAEILKLWLIIYSKMLGVVNHKSQNKQKKNGLKGKVRKVGGHLDGDKNLFE